MTIAGSDSGGGAGIQADLKAFSFFHVFGTTAITAITAQNPKQVIAVQPLPSEIVSRQIEAIFAEIKIGAVKTGMLFSGDIIQAVADRLNEHPEVPLVVDPVMVATSGAKLLQDKAVGVLQNLLLPRAAVITPNLPEAQLLVGQELNTPRDMMAAAAALARKYAAIVIVKGGHNRGNQSTDIVSDGCRFWELHTPTVAAAATHGTGCSLSAAVAACIAVGNDPYTAIRKAKAYLFGALKACIRIGPDVSAMDPPVSLVVENVVFRELSYDAEQPRWS